MTQNPTVQHHLNLLGRACSDVGKRPAHFPSDLLVWTAHQSAEGPQSSSVNHKLCHAVIPGQHIAQCSEARHLNVQVIEFVQLNQSLQKMRLLKDEGNTYSTTV